MAKNDKINFSTPSGFPEFLPSEKRLELYLLDTIRRVYESYGFTPIETPAVERLEVLQAKGNQGDNIIYGIDPILPPNRQAEKDKSGETGSEARALKFDQTVPLAAYIARHLNELTFPFARYQMDVVFRGERAKDGRFRQFRQCDIDVVGREKLSLLYDAQMPAIITEIFEAVHIGDFLIRINNRKVLTGFFQSLDISETQIKSCISIIDNLEKIGEAKVKLELEKEGINPEQTQKIIDFIKIDGSVDDVLDKLKHLSQTLPESEQFNLGVSELETVITGVRNLGVPDKRFCIDLAIARGLNYYTGTVYETTLIGHEALGSICSGGRYEELVGTFIGEKMPGVGISIGLTRLISRLLKAGILNTLPPTPAQVVVVNMQDNLMPTYLKVSQQLRQAGLNVITNFEKRQLGKQFQAADKQGIQFCVIIGADEAAAQKSSLKDLKSGEQVEVALADLPEEVKRRLT
ncbi:histidyl-tRNA synthetase [Trichormus variabilis ATCC 29413]|uniref:Histidine--tRNA ligase n=2 Tax=Anabaena variabilis TaxID=264691 RepID=SYH_TRIV2|nr:MULTISPECIES: histidine--tRNA ligase [Nostocaceae]Q3MAV8.1 RecName: Full=Histidine--tRNA ligase; AltName: Full=Histidyl-tRNA synthetase; Short=HisRS [Trichormus variabilis ATCC 29413]ABA21878.1 histidyl-tRNA synthetase [Trichormus variabilis ATCC 29413]MBC1213425.1 histidine--tRNA ligase [Trichormus variabilis ARAD]MBC1254432.1 histidine--tRNA ligase [Trichormus variabilis V5]MBC1267887.1 histidine--tRNA ligase [Trichormus variabilis FSR]MBC1302417.1 histidine--tRNA ligase [Trichormus vari